MTIFQAPRAYDSLAAFYQDVYAHALRETRPAGRTGAVMMRFEQEAGDWSDAPSPDLVVSFITSGNPPGTIDVGDGRFRSPSRPGSFVVIPPHYGTTFLMDGEHKLMCLAVPYAGLIDLAGSQSGLPADGDFGPLHAGLNTDMQVPGLLRSLWAEASNGSPHGSLRSDGLLLQLAACLLQIRDRQDGRLPSALSKGGLSPWQVKRVLEYLAGHLAQDVSLGELAAIAGLSPAHFCRAFKQSTGRSPLQQLIGMRIDTAKDLLADPMLPIIEVAAACGYESPGAFSQAFKRETGMTPSAWRTEKLS